MPSTYTTNSSLEKPATGEQSGLWGDTVNLNLDLIDEALDGVASVSVAGQTAVTVAITAGELSQGRCRILRFTGNPGGHCTVTFTPTSAVKWWVVRNETTGGFNIICKQGSGAATTTVPAGKHMAVFADGSDEIHPLLKDPQFETVKATGTITGASFTDGTNTTAMGGGNLTTAGRLVKVSAAGIVTEDVTPVTDIVKGAAALTLADRFVKVSSAGTVTEDGSFTTVTVVRGAGNLTASGRFVKVSAAGIVTEDSDFTTTTVVRGAGSLANAGRFVKVSSSGVVTEDANFTTTTVVRGADNLGTASYVPRVSSAGVLTQGVIQDNGTKVGIGMSPPTQGQAGVACSGGVQANRLEAEGGGSKWVVAPGIAGTGTFDIAKSSDGTFNNLLVPALSITPISGGRYRFQIALPIGSEAGLYVDGSGFVRYGG
jgi:hypothetical protein